MAAAGGAVIGGGIGLMHFTGMRALVIPGTLAWDRGLALASIAIGVGLASAALLAWHGLDRRKAVWIAPGLLALAICGLHFTAMGAATMVPDPTIAFLARTSNGSTLAIAVTAVTMLVMLALLAMTLITSQGKRDALLRNQELVDAALEGLVIARDGIVVNVNRRILDLTLLTRAELLGMKRRRGPRDRAARRRRASWRQGERRRCSRPRPASPSQVEVVRRPLSGSERANEVYAIRDLTRLAPRRARAAGARTTALQPARGGAAYAEPPLRGDAREHAARLVHDRSDASRIVVCNKRYVEMYDLPAHLARSWHAYCGHLRASHRQAGSIRRAEDRGIQDAKASTRHARALGRRSAI